MVTKVIKKVVKSSSSRFGGSIPYLPKMGKWVKSRLLRVRRVGQAHQVCHPPLLLLTREHRGFFYFTLDHTREASQEWQRLLQHLSRCVHISYLFHGNHLPLPSSWRSRRCKTRLPLLNPLGPPTPVLDGKAVAETALTGSLLLV